MNHLDNVKMSYFEHLTFAWLMGIALLIHGVFPTVLTTYASDKMAKFKKDNAQDS